MLIAIIAVGIIAFGFFLNLCHAIFPKRTEPCLSDRVMQAGLASVNRRPVR